MKKFRKLKIHPKHRFRTWDTIIIPEIRLEGRWLQKLGFEEGGEVMIEQEWNKLTIRPHEKPGEE